MKKIAFSFFILLTYLSFGQQSFAGFRGGYYSGVLNSLSNPALLSCNPRHWDVNLVSFDANISNNKIEFDTSDIEKSIEKFSDASTYRDFSGSVHADVLLPSFFIRANDKHSLGLISRARAFVSTSDIDAKVIESFLRDPKDMVQGRTDVSIQNQGITANAFMDFGLVWAGSIYNNGQSHIKAGATLKYVRGSMNSRLFLNDIQGRINVSRDKAILEARGNIEAINSGVSIYNFKGEDLLNSAADGVGLDLGLVYEFKSNPDDPTYKVRASVALTDLGRLKYTPIKDEAFRYTLSGAEVDLSSDNLVDELNNASSSVMQKTELSQSYKASLPTAFQMAVDYHIYKNFYIDASSIIGITKKDDKPQNAYYLNSVTFTPRFENKYFGVYLPLNVNQISKFSAGTALRLGPVFLGSSSLFNNLGDKSKGIDFFFGIRFGR